MSKENQSPMSFIEYMEYKGIDSEQQRSRILERLSEEDIECSPSSLVTKTLKTAINKAIQSLKEEFEYANPEDFFEEEYCNTF